jgi:hypothetical protein
VRIGIFGADWAPSVALATSNKLVAVLENIFCIVGVGGVGKSTG